MGERTASDGATECPAGRQFDAGRPAARFRPGVWRTPLARLLLTGNFPAVRIVSQACSGRNKLDLKLDRQFYGTPRGGFSGLSAGVGAVPE